MATQRRCDAAATTEDEKEATQEMRGAPRAWRHPPRSLGKGAPQAHIRRMPRRARNEQHEKDSPRRPLCSLAGACETRPTSSCMWRWALGNRTPGSDRRPLETLGATTHMTTLHCSMSVSEYISFHHPVHSRCRRLRAKFRGSRPQLCSTPGQSCPPSIKFRPEPAERGPSSIDIEQSRSTPGEIWPRSLQLRATSAARQEFQGNRISATPNSGRNSAKSADSEPALCPAPDRPKLGPEWTRTVRCWSLVGRNRLRVGQHLPQLAEFGQHQPKFDQHRPPSIDQHLPNLAGFGQMLVELGQNSATLD